MSLTVTVSQLNAYTASIFKENKNFRSIMVRGEISGFVNYTKSGHFYFTLKEGGAAVKAVMFSRYASALRFMPENGMNVVVSASVEVYERDGVYQLYVSDMIPDGIGSMYLAVEQLKARLAEEGYFSEAYKKPIPRFPSKIGIVTSPEAAALRDIIQILGRRYPAAEAVLFPCMVQGTTAPKSIAQALSIADRSGCDVIICGRGGGSPEDLMAYNTEIVAKAIFDCETPVISAVGHETDTSISDYVADLRAPTPSAAAELAVPLMSDLLDELDKLSDGLNNGIEAYIHRQEMYTDSLEKRLELLSPEKRLGSAEEKLDICEKRLNEAIAKRLEREELRFSSLAYSLDALSPLKVMTRGYSIVYKDGKAVSSSSELLSGDRINIHLSDGEVNAEVL